tara:strand:- start:150 stop:1478 length:1329 start_codon:yes stop_codon:yes gene_type:complete
MLSFKELSEKKKTNILINPKKTDLQEKNHGEDCDCPKCEKKRRSEDVNDGPDIATEEACGKGMYYCHDDKKCKPIPKGYKEGKDGMLVAESKAVGAVVKQLARIGAKKLKSKKVKKAIYKKGKEIAKKVGSAGLEGATDAAVDRAREVGSDTVKNVGKKKKKIDEAKVDQGKDDYAKMNDRNQRTFGNRRGSKKSNQKYDDTEARRYNTEKGRGVKMRGKKDKTRVNYHEKDRQKAVDELLGRVRKEEVKRDEYGDIVGGPKISKKQKAKNLSKNEPDNKIVRSEAAAWTRKAGKNKEGGLNEKGRKSYERENPGSDLKAPSKKVGNPRRKSFCARMRGMKKKLTSAKTARDPDSRINKSLRAWNCSYEWPKDKEMIETTSLKNEIIAKAQEKHKEAKQKKYKQIMDAGKAAKKKVGKDPRGVRALSKGKWGYVKNNTFTPD